MLEKTSVAGVTDYYEQPNMGVMNLTWFLHKSVGEFNQ